MSESIINKIKGLLAKAESLKEIGNLAEAESFMQKAHELMMKHNIDMHKIRMAQAKDGDEFSGYVYGEFVDYKENLAGGRWKQGLIKTICKFNLTGVVFYPKSKRFRVYGLAENVESCVWLYNFLSTRLLNMAKQSRAELDPFIREQFCRHTYLKNFLLGAVDGIYTRLSQQVETAEVNALIKYNDAALEKYINKADPETYQSNPKSINLGIGYAEGLKAAAGMSLGARLTEAEKLTKKLLK